MGKGTDNGWILGDRNSHWGSSSVISCSHSASAASGNSRAPSAGEGLHLGDRLLRLENRSVPLGAGILDDIASKEGGMDTDPIAVCGVSHAVCRRSRLLAMTCEIPA